MLDRISRITSYFLLLFSALLLLALSILNFCCNSKQIQLALIVILFVILCFDAIVTIIKIGPNGFFLKAIIFFVLFGVPLVCVFVLPDYGTIVICAGIIIGGLDIANIIFYAWDGNVDVIEVYQTTEPGVDIIKKEYEGFNDFATLPKKTWINFLINLPSRLLVLVLSFYVGLHDTYIDGEGYYNYWDKTTQPWTYETGQRKLLDPAYLKTAGIIYLIGAALCLLIFAYFIIRVLIGRKKMKKNKNTRNWYEADVERDIRESINSRNC